MFTFLRGNQQIKTFFLFLHNVGKLFKKWTDARHFGTKPRYVTNIMSPTSKSLLCYKSNTPFKVKQKVEQKTAPCILMSFFHVSFFECVWKNFMCTHAIFNMLFVCNEGQKPLHCNVIMYHLVVLKMSHWKEMETTVVTNLLVQVQHHMACNEWYLHWILRNINKIKIYFYSTLYFLAPLHPTISIHNFYTILYTFLLVLTREFF